MNLSREQLATILAALRYYQFMGCAEPGFRPEAIHDIATDEGNLTSLNDTAIDELCEELNTADTITFNRGTA